LEPSAIVEGGLVIEPVPRRNANYRLTTRQGPQYLIKQATGPENAATLAREAAMYRLLAQSAAPFARRCLPQLHGHDDRRGLLILELFVDAQDLRRQFAHGTFPVDLVAAAGAALGALHRATAREKIAALAPALGPPWAASLHHPAIDWMRDLSAADVELISLVQRSSEFCKLLDAERTGWQGTCVIHGDYKWDNCLATDGGGVRSVRLVDWEAAGWGDPAWDVGSAFTDFLGDWLGSIPLLGAPLGARLSALARHPLTSMRPSLRAFWSAYIAAVGVSGPDANQLLLRATRYGGVRLLQSAFEHGQHAGELMASMATLAQLAFNVLRRPHEAAVHLLGIPFERPATA
jgi:aminoglycoside phosphotransferase (APT) family kinase protein